MNIFEQMKFDDLPIGKFFRCRIDGKLSLYKKFSNARGEVNAVDMLLGEAVAMMGRADLVEPLDVTITYTLPDETTVTQRFSK